MSETVAIKWIARWRRTGSVAAKRERWRQRQGGFDPGRLVFIDETWAFALLRLARDLLSAKLLIGMSQGLLLLRLARDLLSAKLGTVTQRNYIQLRLARDLLSAKLVLRLSA